MSMPTTPSMITTSFLIGPLLYILYRFTLFYLDLRRRGKAVDQFEGEPRHWLWGHLHLYPGPNEAGLAYDREQTALRPRAIAIWRGPFPSVLVYHPDTVLPVVKSSEPKPKFGVYTFGKRWLGDGLLISGGNKWARNRRLLTPAFHFDILKPYVKIHNEATDVLMNKMAKYAESGEIMEISSHVSLATLDVILRCAFSYENDCQEKGEDHPYVLAVTELGDLWVKRTLEPWVYLDWIYYLTPSGKKFKANCDFVHSVSKEIIEKRRKTLSRQKDSSRKVHTRYLDFLDILLTARDEDGCGLTDQEIQDEVDTFLVEGHDTTASSISWTLYSLAEHPDFQQKCREEIDDIFMERGEHPDVTWDDLPKLKYLTMCIKESMRLHCPVPFIERQLTKDMTIDGKTLPAGTIIDIHIYNLHHNPTVWIDPMEYRPERFSAANLVNMDPFSFIPFSAGPRNCIGQNFAMQEQKIVIAKILHRFKIQLDPNFKTEKKLGIVMKTVNGMRMKVAPRCAFY